MSQITTAVFWRAAGSRVLYTFLATLVPYVILVQTGEVEVYDALSIAGLAGLASLVTSFANLPEISTATMPMWKAIGHRVLRTFGQNVAAGIAGFVLLQDVPWSAILVGVAGAVVTTLIRTVLDVLPESVAQAPAVESVTTGTGVEIAGEASQLPTGAVILGAGYPASLESTEGAHVVEASEEELGN